MASGVNWSVEDENESLKIYLKEYKSDNKKLIFNYKKVVTAEQWDKVKKKLNYTDED